MCIRDRPLVGRLGQHRQVGVHGGRSNRVAARVEVGDVLGVGVEPVERVADVVGGALEVRRRAHHVRVVELLEPDDGVHLVQVGGPQGGERDRLSADGAPVAHHPVLGAQRAQGVGALGRAVREGGLPLVAPLQPFHGHALAVEQVVLGVAGHRPAVRPAQRHRVGVDDVLVGRGGAPRVVHTSAQLDVHAHPGEGRAARADARALQLLEDQQLRGEVPGLRAEHGHRVAVLAVRPGHHQGVGHAVRPAQQVGGQHAPVEDPAQGLQFRGGTRGPGVTGRCRPDLLRPGRPGGVVDDRLVGHRARVRQGHPRGLGRAGRVREGLAVVQGQHGLGVVLLAERRPGPLPGLRAERVLRGQQHQRGLHLTAATGTEQRAHHRGDGHQVGGLERLDLAGVGDRVHVPGQHVLAGEVAAPVGLVDVGVDAGQVVGDVLERLLAGRAGRGDPVDLGLQVGLGVGGGGPEGLLQCPVGGRAAGERGQLAPADVPEQVHQPEPVLCGGVAGAELGARPGGAVDVRHAQGLVPHDGHVRARAGGGLHLVGRHAEGRGVEERAELLVGQPGVATGQVGVLAQLVGAVLGPDAQGAVGQDLGQGGVAVGARWQHVEALGGAVVRRGEGAGRGRLCGGRG